MSDELFNNNQNDNNSSENNSNEPEINNDSYTNSNHTNNRSSYSFWAEQIASSDGRENGYYHEKSDSGDKRQSETQSHIFDMSSNTTNQKTRKTNIFGKAAKFIAWAAVFGIIAGASFVGFNTIYYNINPNAKSISIQIGSDDNWLNGYKFMINKEGENSNKIAATTVLTEGVKQETDITNVINSTMPSIVTITTTYTSQSYNWFGQQFEEKNEGGGSGIIVGKNDNELLIATNNHVVEGADPITVTFIDDTSATAIIKGTDAVADLAVISIDLSTISKDTLSKIQIAKLGNSDSVKVGQMAIAIGNALGYGQSTTVGYISAKDREVNVSDKTMVLLQTDAAINPGNSGGALLNMNGEVIGINTVKYASSEVEGMGFAIPISRAMPIINELMNREILADDEKGYLGVYFEEVTEDIATMYNWPVGVYVRKLVEGGAAEKAGVLVGDIITKVNDTEVTAGTQLREKVTSYRAGTDVTLTIMRNNNGQFEEKQIVVTLSNNTDLETNQ